MSRGISKGKELKRSLESKRLVSIWKERVLEARETLSRNLSSAYEKNGGIYFKHTNPYDGFITCMSAEVEFLPQCSEWLVLAIHSKEGVQMDEAIEYQYGRDYYCELEKELCKLMEKP